MSSRRKVFIVAIVVVLLCVAGLIVAVDAKKKSEAAAMPAPSTEVAPTGLKAFYQQKLSWDSCGDDVCTWVKVPVDYRKPQGETLKLRVKLRAAPVDKAEGTLFINPGGPGGSGVDYVDGFVAQASRDVSKNYNVVGFDPRGVAKSTPINCLSDKEFTEYVSFDPDPDSASEVKGFLRQIDKLGQGCIKNNGDLINHVSTIEVARDLDVLRALFGQSKLDYFGASYGTQIGATYAELFAANVDKMVLDGAVDPTLSDEQAGFGQAKGFQQALEAYAKACVARETCPLGKDAKVALQRIGDLINGLDEQPLKTSDKRTLSEAMGFYGVAVTLYNKDTWPLLTRGLELAQKGDGSGLQMLADAYFSRNPDGSYADNSGEVIAAVRCLDSPGDVTVDDVLGFEPKYLKASPIFGRTFAWSALGCTNWPAKSTEKPITIDANGAKPIVVVGTTRDPATPYVWAEALADQLDSGVLVSRDGDGHTGYRAGNACVDKAIDGYLLDAKVPKDGLFCK